MAKKTKSRKVHPKVQAVGIGGAASILFVWILHQFVHVDVPGDVAAAITTVVSFVSGYSVSGE